MRRWLAKYIGNEGVITVRSIGRTPKEGKRVAGALLERRGIADGAVFLRIEEICDA